jgi:hypothetical protein
MQQQTVQVKVQFNGELRRFSLSQFSVVELEKTIKHLFKLDRPFILKFKDDEEDWVTFSTDAELIHAQQLNLTKPFRVLLVVEDRKKNNEKMREMRRDLRRECKSKTGNWRKDKIQAKLEFLTRRVQIVQARLEAGKTTSNHTRALIWRLQKIEEKKKTLECKLSRFEENKTGKLENPDTKVVLVINPTTRRCKVACKLSEEMKVKIAELRNNLKEAQISGDKQRVRECRQQLIALQKEIRSTRQQARLTAAKQEPVKVEEKVEEKVEQKAEEKVASPCVRRIPRSEKVQRVPRAERVQRVTRAEKTQTIPKRTEKQAQKITCVRRVPNPRTEKLVKIRAVPVQPQQTQPQQTQVVLQQQPAVLIPRLVSAKREAAIALRTANRAQKLADRSAKKEALIARKAAWCRM